MVTNTVRAATASNGAALGDVKGRAAYDISNLFNSSPSVSPYSGISTNSSSRYIGGTLIFSPSEHALSCADESDRRWFEYFQDCRFRWRLLIPLECSRALPKLNSMYEWHVIVFKTATNELQRLPIIARSVCSGIDYDNTDAALREVFHRLVFEQDEFRFRDDPDWLRSEDAGTPS
jgi:hypothetical protein